MLNTNLNPPEHLVIGKADNSHYLVADESSLTNSRQLVISKIKHPDSTLVCEHQYQYPAPECQRNVASFVVLLRVLQRFFYLNFVVCVSIYTLVSKR